ncbi:MAG: ATP-binding cassette domain-containing protein, partial [Rhodospirillales bacterium]|nr:ATP-binding cassette domain-containing protein [Rhodospirillales bacterium]
MLSVSGVHTYYGQVQALRGVDIEVKQGEIVTLIGANGAGKSTLLMTISGAPHPQQGRVTFDGQDITDLPPHEIVRLGIAQSPEGRRIFPRMSVYENLQMGSVPSRSDHFDEALEQAYELFPILKERQDQRAGTL